MVFTNSQFIKLLGFATFELFIHVVGLLVFSVLVCCKIEEVITSSWWHVFIPLYVSDALSFYYSTIVYIRSISTGRKMEANRRAIWIVMCLSLYFLFKMLLCNLLEGTIKTHPSYVMAPIFTLWILLLVRSCKVT